MTIASLTSIFSQKSTVGSSTTPESEVSALLSGADGSVTASRVASGDVSGAVPGILTSPVHSTDGTLSSAVAWGVDASGVLEEAAGLLSTVGTVTPGVGVGVTSGDCVGVDVSPAPVQEIADRRSTATAMTDIILLISMFLYLGFSPSAIARSPT